MFSERDPRKGMVKSAVPLRIRHAKVQQAIVRIGVRREPEASAFILVVHARQEQQPVVVRLPAHLPLLQHDAGLSAMLPADQLKCRMQIDHFPQSDAIQQGLVPRACRHLADARVKADPAAHGKAAALLRIRILQLPDVAGPVNLSLQDSRRQLHRVAGQIHVPCQIIAGPRRNVSEQNTPRMLQTVDGFVDGSVSSHDDDGRFLLLPLQLVTDLTDPLFCRREVHLVGLSALLEDRLQSLPGSAGSAGSPRRINNDMKPHARPPAGSSPPSCRR